MKRLLQLVAIIAAGLFMAGCSADVNRFWQGVGVVSGATVPGYTVVAAAQSFDGSQLVAAAYLRLPPCMASRSIGCRVRADTPIIKGAFLSGRIARSELLVQLRAACATEYAAGAECTAGIPIASYNTLVAATQTIDAATAAYRSATAQK